MQAARAHSIIDGPLRAGAALQRRTSIDYNTAISLCSTVLLRIGIVVWFEVPLLRLIVPVALALFLAVADPVLSSALASTAIIPDDFPSVQLAVDSGADTVLLRDGSYPERLFVDRALVLQGIGLVQRPRLAALDIHNSNFWADPPLLRVSGIDFSGRVTHTTVYYRPRQLQLSFSECAMDSGFVQTTSMDPYDVALLEIRKCRLGNRSTARAYQVVMQCDTIDGGVAWRVREGWIEDCWFRGGQGRALELTDWPWASRAARNRIENYDTGIFIEDASDYVVERNAIRNCLRGIQVSSGNGVRVVENEIRDCYDGLWAGFGSNIALHRNSVFDAEARGIVVVQSGVVVEANVVGRCQGEGVALQGPDTDSAVRWNTIFESGGSGIVVSGAPDVVGVRNNIAFRNGGWGLSVEDGALVSLGCNDWFGNGLGDVSGLVPDSTDLNVDPEFCAVDSSDVRLNAASPLLDLQSCGVIGAMGVGCGVTATLVQRFSAARVNEGVRVVWEVAGDAPAAEI